MEDIGIRELKAQASEIIHKVKEEGERYVVTHRGKPVAILMPIEEAHLNESDLIEESEQSAWDELVRLGNEIGRNWESEQKPSEILSDMRR